MGALTVGEAAEGDVGEAAGDEGTAAAAWAALPTRDSTQS